MTACQPDDTDVAVILDEMRAACREWEVVVLPGERVRTDEAARLIGWQPRTLEHWRYEGIGPEVTRGPRPSYTLAALAVHVATERAKHAGSYGLVPGAT